MRMPRSARVVLVLCLLLPAACTTTKVKLLGPADPPVDPSQVALYGSMPKRFRAIALVEAHVYFPMFFSEERKTGMAVEALSEAAAGVGADGLMIRNLHPGAVRAFGYGHRAFRMGTTENAFAHMTAMHGVAIATR